MQARVSFGVALGHLLPEEQMATAARWTGRALRLARDLDDRDLLASVLRMHGNELRKAGRAAAVREVSIRGLLATGRTGQAVDLAERFAAGESPPTPQWRVIEQVTTADLLARAGDDRASVGMLSAALSDAETLHLPHQVQRIIRLTDVAGGLRNPTFRMQAEAALTRMDQRLTEATSVGGEQRLGVERRGAGVSGGSGG